MTMWGTLAPISGAAIASGNLQVEGRRQSMQHPYGGVVRQLLVRDGAHVEKGQLLIRLDDSEPRAKLEVLLAERDAALAAEARLIAERDGRDAPDFGDDLRAQRDKAAVRQAMANEVAMAMMAARKHQFDAETAVLRRRIAQLEAQIGGTQAQLRGTEKQHELLTDELNGAQQLFAQGYARRRVSLRCSASPPGCRPRSAHIRRASPACSSRSPNDLEDRQGGTCEDQRDHRPAAHD